MINDENRWLSDRFQPISAFNRAPEGVQLALDERPALLPRHRCVGPAPPAVCRMA